MVRIGFLMLALAPTMISAAAPKAESDRPEAAADKQDRVICKSFPVIGSLVATTKECKTKRQWEAERNNLTQRNPFGSCAGSGGAGGGPCSH